MLDPGKSVFYQMPISVKPSIQIRIAFSRDHGFVILLFNLFQYGLTVIDLFRNDRLRSGNGGLKEQVQQSVNFSEHANHETGHSRLRNIVTTWRLNEPSLPD